MTPRSQRRQRKKQEPPAAPRRRILLLAGGLAVVAAVAAAVVLVVLFVFGDGDGDESDIETLAQRSIEVLPAGEWPSLYDSFTAEFRARCSRLEFTAAGVEAAEQLGDDLPFLQFRRVEEIAVQGQDARAVIVGQVAGQPEYKLRAVFRKQDGQWKLAPASNTEGCEAFRRL